MGCRAGGDPPKIVATIELYNRYTEAVIAELALAGIRWCELGEGCTWDEAIAVLSCAPAWGPLQRAMNPQNWIWGIPGYDEIVTVVELLATGNVQRGNASGAKRSDFPKRIRRPYEEREVVESHKVGKPEDARVVDSLLSEYAGVDFSAVLTR